jgi:hypothetical protein
VCGPFYTKKGVLSETWATDEAKKEYDVVVESGRIPLLQKELDQYQTIAAAIQERLDGLEIDFPGSCELAIEWTEIADDGQEVLCRCSMDHVVLFTGQIDDFKTSKVSVHPAILPKWAEAYGWDIKEAAYRRALEALKPELTGRVSMRFICAETIPPYDVVAKPLDGTFRTMGEDKWRRAVNMYAACTRTKHWPGYSSAGAIEAPTWAMNALLESKINADLDNDDLEAWNDGTANAAF